jgi:hypothetical protein
VRQGARLPTAPGTRTGAITITNNAPGSPRTISLTGIGLVSGLGVTLSPTSLTFPEQPLQVTSAAQTVTLTNLSTAALAVTSIAVVGDFDQTNNCGTGMGSGYSCAISVTFTPKQAGTRTGSLTVNVAGVSPLVVELSGTSTNPVPFINQPLLPDAVAPGGPPFTLTVNGTGFVSGSVVNWNGSALVTQFINGLQLKATVPAADIATPSTASVTVVNPAPGGGTSNVALFTATANTLGTVLFSLTSSLVTDFGPGSSVVVGDFNGDGKLDLAAASYGYVRILLGGGTGNFTLASSLGSVLGYPPSVAVGDFNGDGKLDLAVVGYDTVRILLGDGRGNFLASSLDVGGALPSAAVGDFNGDGKLDLAVANGNNTVSILLGDGTGSFALASSPAVGYGPESVAVGDFNGDGKLDLAVANENGNTVSILLGDGAGNFTLASAPVAYGASVAVGDFNGDGKLDLATGGGTSILLGDSTGNFTLASSPLVGGTSVAVADFNGDGRLDLAVAHVNAVSILLGDGTGNFTVASSPATGAAYYPTSVAVGDFNGDGRLDLAVANFNGKNENSVSILLQPKPSAEVALSATTSTFGAQLVGTTSAAQPVTLSNTGAAILAITSIAATGDYSETNSCGTSVAGGASCIINVTFTPTAPGTRSGKIIIKDNAAGSPQVVQLTGIGTAVSLSATSLTFPLQKVGTTASRIVTLTNHGRVPVSVTSAAATGDFRSIKLCRSVPPKASCRILVLFKPTQTGLRTGVLTITDSDPASPQMVALTGTGTAAAVALSVPSLNFAGQLVGTSSTPQSVTLTNTGDGPLTVSNITASGDFTSTAGQCAGTMAAGASCEITVVFKPQAGGSRTGSLSIVDDAATSPQSVALSGTGQDFGVSASTTSATVTAGQTASYTLRLASEGGFSGAVSLTCTGAPATATCSLTPSSVTLTGSGAAPISVRVTTTARSMAPSAGRRLPPGSVSPAVLLLLTLLIALAMVAGTRRDSLRKRRLVWAPLGAALLLITIWTGCGGGIGTIGPPPVTGTRAGTYTLTVAASDSGLTKNVSLTLVVN